jgi:hypothetical protein
MKKYLLAAALVVVSTSAMADRVEIGQAHGSRTNRLEVCDRAKFEAKRVISSDEEIRGYSGCDCEESPPKSYEWSCSVEATVGKKR